ncbi:MAG: D-alanine--D-alanine ligase [Planctomycetota bacterium]|jgi:D-alanine-D-alanine ligase|nr:D-alanine--D-alanine ligase [Planctomycetota bacterium]
MMSAFGLEDLPVFLIYDGQALNGGKADRDVVNQLDAVEAALIDFGCVVRRLAADLDFAGLKETFQREKPRLVFNLVESLDGADRLQTLIPLFLENWRLPFTGSGSTALFLSNHKILAKRIMAAQGIATPAAAWLENGSLAFFPENGTGMFENGDWLIKTVDSHASVYIDDHSLLRQPDAAGLAERLREAEAAFTQPFFAERFVKGREFNVGILEGENGRPEILPVAEIDFSLLSPDRPPLVGYAAKWHEESEEYRATRRVFPVGSQDEGLTRELADMALAVWQSFGLAGYARVDFRVDGEGRPFVLEANANPCLAPDAGFAAAAERIGFGYSVLVRRISLAGLRRSAPSPESPHPGG